MDNQKKIFFLIIVLLILGAITTVVLQSQGKAVSSTKYDSFAQCLASKNLTMYGAVWCPHCKAQKALFGDSFKYASYVECTEKPEECTAKGIEGYPTWVDASGQKYVGEQTLQKLSEISGCQLPAN